MRTSILLLMLYLLPTSTANYTVLLNLNSFEFIRSKTLLQIIKNAPNINRVYANQIAYKLAEFEEVYQIPANVFAAILMQESSYRLHAVNHTTNDYGIAQINIVNIRHMNLNKDRLIKDLNYSLDSSAKILKKIKDKHSSIEIKWWSRYNSSNNKARVVYEKKIKKFL